MKNLQHLDTQTGEFVLKRKKELEKKREEWIKTHPRTHALGTLSVGIILVVAVALAYIARHRIWILWLLYPPLIILAAIIAALTDPPPADDWTQHAI